MKGFRAVQWACLLLLTGSSAAAATGVASQTEAARFLNQATLGADFDEIQRTAYMGHAAWIEEQFQRPIGYHQPALEERLALGLEVDNSDRRHVWWKQIMDGPDPLRQRVGLALSEILVVSDNLGNIRDNPVGMANYYDMLLEHSFGNYRDILHDVTLHPIMGTYLSHLKNERSSGGRFPDENYAREIMQLFSVGLYMLNPDGTHMTNGAGESIPTYDNDDITEMAKIFTGLSFDSPSRDFRQGLEVWTQPMRMYDEFHEPGPKNLLRGGFAAPGRTGMEDINAAVDNLFNHPNVGPFIGRRLIQRLVTSNPSPEYMARVTTAFNDNGSGVRGDMRAVIRAILLDPEARSRPTSGDIHRGMLRESYLRRVHLARAFNASNFVSTFPITDSGASSSFDQHPLSAPTVFNFFLPDYQPAGEIADAGLVAPEFQIITAVTAITSANVLRTQVDSRMNSDSNDALEVTLDLTREIALASDVRALIDRLDLVMMYGSMSQPMRQVLIQALEQLTNPEERAKMAIHLISISPEYCVLK